MDSLCQLAGEFRGDLPSGGLAFERKFDGFRALFFRGFDGKPRLWTRNGHRIEGAEHIVHRCGLFERMAGQPLFIDGEFVVDGSLEATKRWCESGWRRGGEAGLFYAFDIVPVVNWVTGSWEKPWVERKAWLAKLARQVETDAALAWEWRPGSRGRDDAESPVIIVEDAWAFDRRDVLHEARSVDARTPGPR
jgi:ATP-dependent DNA ligase